jgi:hypothetical protein
MKTFIMDWCIGGAKVVFEGQKTIYANNSKDAIKQGLHYLKEMFKEDQNVEFDLFEKTHWVCLGRGSEGKDIIEKENA